MNPTYTLTLSFFRIQFNNMLSSQSVSCRWCFPLPSFEPSLGKQAQLTS